MTERGSATKRHNPVDSIRRKIETIKMSDQESSPYLQIPKFPPRNFDSPQSSTKKDLEEVLKNRTVKSTSKDPVSLPDTATLASFAVPSPRLQQVPDCDSPLASVLASRVQQKKVWPSCGSQSCSTPVVRSQDAHLKFHQSILPCSEFKSIILEERVLPSVSSFYLDRKTDHFTLRSPVVKRLSMSESAGLRRMTDNKMEPMAEVSLICEEDLLDSIFHACDTERRGKVAVSKIVDYLRHTTSRGSEDSGLGELCNMLDPEKRDISMDLDTYHAIMKEWVDDCRNNGTQNTTKESVLVAEESLIKLRESLQSVRRISGTTMNITSGSLEAFGGGHFQRFGHLGPITCIADLQYNNQKLQERKNRLKTAMEAQEDTNNRLLEEIEELRNQLKSTQYIKPRREIKSSSCLEQPISCCHYFIDCARYDSSWLVALGNFSKNIRNTLEVEEVRKTLSEVTDKAAEFQMQLKEFETVIHKKDAGLLLKDVYVDELKSTVVEYYSVIENLRVEKNKLENNLQQMEHELLSNGISSPITNKLNRGVNGCLNSLHTELEFAQDLPEVSTPEWTFPSGRTSSLDITLDREVLLMLQGPGHEQVGAEFKAILQTLHEDTCAMADHVLLSLQHLIESDIDVKDLAGRMLQIIKADLKEKRRNWEEKLKQLDKQKDSLDREFVKMSGNLRRMKTEQLHLKKELSTRLHELEAARQQQEEVAERATWAVDQLHQSARKQEDLAKRVAELEDTLHAGRTEAESLRGKLEEAESQQHQLQAAIDVLTSEGLSREQEVRTLQEANSLLQDKLLNYPKFPEQVSVDDGPVLSAGRQAAEHGEEGSCTWERFGLQETGRLSGAHKTSPSAKPLPGYVQLLDALCLEVGQRHPNQRTKNYPATRSHRKPDSPLDGKLRKTSASLDLLIPARPTRVCVGAQTDEDTFTTAEMEPPVYKGHDAGNRPEATGASSTSINCDTSADRTSPLDNTLVSPAPEHRAAEGSVNLKDGDSEAADGKSCHGAKASPDEAVGTSAAPAVKSAPSAEEDHCSSNEREMETEFLRLSLGFKCDLFTLDKRLRLEERSRDLAEENLKKELAGCKKLLEALIPFCEEDNQTHEIVKKLENRLQFLNQHTTRVASRAEMLGAIHQESRVSKAVEVMIQHVENLKRMYAKEHAELEELREAMQQNERSSSSAAGEDPHKLVSAIASKVSPARRVSMPAYTRGTGSPMDMFGGDKLDGKLHKRSNSWKLVGSRQNDRPTLQRFVDNYTRTEPSEENFIKEDETNAELPEEAEVEENIRRCSLLQKTHSPAKPGSFCSNVSSWMSDLKTSFSNTNKPLLISVLTAFLLISLVSFLTGLSFQKPVEGAPVGSGVSWTSVQQLLWPYTKLRHNAPPPV
ncbi:LOW QUALITY PROTEIN: inositol 1,4,5-triphosphate receptor associated 2 [Pseudophryne corroboree]|uniref:LOW QUALITY PROTEIN: inositol 1,4,5-triphosphate receptor associated 2 n=1 Tax=Pseudophryne corroboree TaxID=495146 RepID=UPI0030820609